MDRYHRVEKPREEAPIKENEIRITTQGRMRNYITYATTLLQEKALDEIVFKAMGRAINKTVMIVELIKRRIVGLHQATSIGSIDITDTWEPLEEGLLPLETTRHVSVITIILSKTDQYKSSVGYQPPLPEDQVKPLVEYEYDEEGAPGVRGRGRGGRGRGRARENGVVNHNIDGEWDNRGRGGYNGNGYPRGRGRGGFRGRGRRGGFGGGGMNYQQEPSGYYDGPPPPMQSRGGWGRGRARGRGQGRGRGRDANSNGYHADSNGA